MITGVPLVNIEENIKIIRQALVSRDVPKVDIDAMIEAYRKSVRSRNETS